MDFGLVENYDGDCWHVILSGEVDIYNSAEMKTRLTALMREHTADLHVDCRDLEYIDSTGLGALVGVFKFFKAHDKMMCLYNVKPNILKLFRITNLDKFFTIKEGRDE